MPQSPQSPQSWKGRRQGERVGMHSGEGRTAGGGSLWSSRKGVRCRRGGGSSSVHKHQMLSASRGRSQEGLREEPQMEMWEELALPSPTPAGLGTSWDAP